MNDSQADDSGRPARRGDRENGRDVPRRGDRPAARRRDNSSFGERRGKRYDGAESGRGDDPRGGSRQSGSGDRRRGDDDRRGQRGARPARAGGRPGEDRRAGGRPGQTSERRTARVDEPEIPEEIEASELDMEVRRDLRSLDKGNADMVARHLLAAMYLVDDDPERALAHGRAAKNRAGRIGVVRETVGVLAYRAGEWAEALGELRAARRISGGPGLLAMMADCERGLGRPEKAIELARGEESRAVEGEDLVELRIVEAGARVDMGQLDAALVTLQDAGLDAAATGEEAARLDYAYAEVLLAASRRTEALEWFRNAAAADAEDSTDAASRVAELEG